MRSPTIAWGQALAPAQEDAQSGDCDQEDGAIAARRKSGRERARQHAPGHAEVGRNAPEQAPGRGLAEHHVDEQNAAAAAPATARNAARGCPRRRTRT